MKNNIITIFSLCGAMAFISSCNESPDYPVSKTGSLSLKGLGVEVQNVEKVVNSRATYDITPFIVKITDDRDQVVGNYTYGTMPEIVSLAPGHYRVDVASHEVQKAEWEKPYFVGSQEFDIVASEITQVSHIVCKFASVKVTVNFDDDLRAVMGDDVKVSVVANDEGRLDFTADNTSAGYFAVVEGSNTLVATFTGQVLGYQECIIKTFTSVEPGQYYNLTFRLKNNQVEPEEETGYINPGEGISIDTDITGENIAGSATFDEDIIENPGERPGGELFSEKVTMNYDEGTQILAVEAPAGLRSLTVGYTTDNSDLAAELASLNGADLAQTSAAQVASKFGLPAASAVSGAASVNVSLATIFDLCAQYEGHHAIIFTGTDVNNEYSSFQVVAPGMKVEADIKIEADDLSFETPNTPAEGVSGLVNITASAGIAHLEVTIDTTNGAFESAVKDLLPLHFDLAYPPQDASGDKLVAMFPTGDDVIGKTEVPFDITTFVPLLSAFEGTHTFTIKVTDLTGGEKSVDLVFIVEGE